MWNNVMKKNRPNLGFLKDLEHMGSHLERGTVGLYVSMAQFMYPSKKVSKNIQPVEDFRFLIKQMNSVLFCLRSMFYKKANNISRWVKRFNRTH